MTELLTVKEVAKILHISTASVYAWVKRRRLPHIVLSSGSRKECIRFRSSAIDQWIKERERAGTLPNKWDLR